MSLAIENILGIMDYGEEEELALILSEFICLITQKNTTSESKRHMNRIPM